MENSIPVSAPNGDVLKQLQKLLHRAVERLQVIRTVDQLDKDEALAAIETALEIILEKQTGWIDPNDPD